VSPLFRRNSPDAAPDAAVPEPAGSEPGTEGPPAGSVPVGKAVTAKKGRPTPKRSTVRRVAEPPPKDPKEARKRMRAKMRQERAERFEGMKRGDDQYLLARDKGPVRKLVRDIIDSRRNMGPVFFGTVLVVIAVTLFRPPNQVIIASTFVFYGLFLMLLLDIFLISRRINRAVEERFPDTKERMPALYLYGGMRSISFRKLRSPAPKVKPGDAI
jgi:hypothetical protein